MSTTFVPTGFRDFDEYCGGVREGEIILLLSATSTAWLTWCQELITTAPPRKKFTVINAGEPMPSFLTPSGRFTHRPLAGPKGKKAISPNAVAQALRGIPAGSFVLIENCSLFASPAGQRDLLRQCFDILLDQARKRKLIVFANANRQSLTLDDLAYLKDSASLCLEVVEQEKETVLLPVTMKNRYKPSAESRRSFSLSRIGAPGGEEATASDGLFPAIADPAGEYFMKFPEPLVLIQGEKKLLDLNLRALEYLGLTRDEFLSGHGWKSLQPGDRFRTLRFLRSLRIKRNDALNFSFRRGKHLHQCTARCVSFGKGIYYALLQDRTGENAAASKARHIEQEYRNYLSAQHFPFVIVQDRKIRFISPSFRAALGYPAASDDAGGALTDLFPADALKIIRQAVQGHPDDRRQTVELRVYRADRTTAVCLAGILEIRYQEEMCVQISFVDISPIHQLRERLAQSEQLFRATMSNLPKPVALVRDAKFVYCNNAFLRFFGFSASEEVIGVSHTAIEQQQEISALAEQCSRKQFQKHTIRSFMLRGRNNAGVDVTLRVTATLPAELNGDLLLLYEDATEEIQWKADSGQFAEEMEYLNGLMESLHTREDVPKIAAATIQKFIAVFSWKSAALYLRNSATDEFDISAHKNVPGVLLEKLDHLTAAEGLGGFLAKTQEPHQFTVAKYPAYLPHRSLFVAARFHTVAVIPLLSGMSVVGFILLGNFDPDTTPVYSQRLYGFIGREIGAALAKAQVVKRLGAELAQYHEMVTNGEEIYYQLSPEGALIAMTDNVEQLLGYRPRDFLRNRSLWLSMLHTEDKRILLERATRLAEIRERHTAEYRILPKGRATPLSVRDIVTVQRNADGVIVGYLGILRNVTAELERSGELEQRLRGSEAVISSLPEAFLLCDAQWRIVLANRMSEQLLGRQAEELAGTLVNALFVTEDEQKIADCLKRAFAGERSLAEELRLRQKKNKESTSLYSLACAPLAGPDNAVRSVVMLIADISQHRARELALRNSEQILRNVIDAMGDIFIITDLDGTVRQINKSFERMLGYTSADALNCSFPYPWLVEEEMGRYILWITSLREKNWLHDFDMTWRTKDERRIPLSLSTTLLRNSYGEPIAMLSVARDITDRVRLMNDIARRNKQIELINRVVSKANETNDFEEIFSFLTQEITAMLPASFINVGLYTEEYTALKVYAVSGLTSRQAGDVIPIAETVSQFVLQQSGPVIVNDIQNDPLYSGFDSKKKGVASQLSIPFRLKGRIAGTLNIGSMKSGIFSADHIEIFQPLAQHLGTIIDRVTLFRQVRDDSAYIRTLLDSLDSIVYTVDDQCRIREVNLAWTHFFQQAGVTASSEYYGKDLFEVLPWEELRAMFRTVIPELMNGTIRMFSEEYTHRFGADERVYQITITPMPSGNRVKGLVFTHTDITPLKRSENKLREFNDQLLTLNEIATFINSSVDTGEMLDASLSLLQRVTKSDGIIAFFPGEEQSELVSVKQVGLSTAVFPDRIQLDISRSATGEVYRTREPLFIMGSAAEDGRIMPENRSMLRSAGIETMAVIPLISKDSVVGVLDLFYTTLHHFTEQDRQILSLVGSHLGSAVQTTRLYNELRSQVGRLSVLYDLSARLTSVLEVDQIIRIIADNIHRLVPFTYLNITLCDAASKTQSGHYVITPQQQSLDVQTFHTLSKLQDASPEYIVLDTGTSWFGVDRTILAVPMLSKGTIVGVITLTTAMGSSYRDDQRLLLESIASLAAIALDKGRLYEETLRITEELRRRNKELDDFTYVVSHDLKEPLISIEGFSRILYADYAEVIQKEGKEYLDSVVGAATRMKGLIDDLLMLSRVSRPSESSGPVSMKLILEEIRKDMAFTIRQRNVDLSIPETLPEVWGNETHLKVLFRNLIGNAIKFNDKPDPRVEVGFRNAENNYYLFSVRDNGIGIEKDFYDKIFTIFQRLHRREEYEGSGAGLAIVKKIVEMHKGTIWVESEIGRGSTFFLTIPMTQVL